MKKITFSIILMLIIASKAFSSAIITGRIINAKSRLVTLEYSGASLVSAPNYYGPNRLSAFLNEKNEFRFVIETAKDYCAYSIHYNGGSGAFIMAIRDNDSININVDLSNSDNTFIASGKGSSFVNFWFALEIAMPKHYPELKDEEIINYYENLELSYFNLLQSFKNGIFQKTDRLSVEQTLNINRLIKNTKLNSQEYELIQNRLNFCTSSAIYRTSIEYLLSNVDQYLQLFKNIDLSKILSIKDYAIENLADDYVMLSCLKELINLKDSIYSEEADKYLSENYYKTAKKVLKGDILEKFIADNLYDLLLSGEYKKYEELFRDNKDVLTNRIYLNKLDAFYNNYLVSLNNKEYNLNSSDKILNDSTVKDLLTSLKGEKVYLILWKISPETSYALTPFYELPSLNNIQMEAKDKNIKFIDICLGNDSIKQHWASMIINHQWKGEHYLYSGGNKKDFRKMFNCVDKMQECSGELYYLLDTKGSIVKDNEGELIVEIE
jgi:hypothetical protein